MTADGVDRLAAAKVRKGSRSRQLLQTTDAYKHSANMPPVFSMRHKTSFGEMKPGNGVEPSGDISHTIDATQNVPPKWTMRGRSTGIPKPADQPGPGEYRNPSTLHGSHPLLHQAGRGFSFGSSQRSKTGSNAPLDVPSPLDYNTDVAGAFGTYAQPRVPVFTMRSKLKDPANKEKRPGCTAYNVASLTSKGVMASPQWTMNARPKLVGGKERASWPGPGEHAPRADANGQIYRMPKFSFGKVERFGYMKQYEGPE